MVTTKAPRDAPLQQTGPSRGNRYAPDHGRRVSKEEYWARWYENPYPDIDVSYEWNNGILEAKPPSNAPQIRQYRWFCTLLTCYIQSPPIAKLINLETGVSMTLPDSVLPFTHPSFPFTRPSFPFTHPSFPFTHSSVPIKPPPKPSTVAEPKSPLIS